MNREFQGKMRQSAHAGFFIWRGKEIQPDYC